MPPFSPRILPRFIALLALSVSHALGEVLEARQVNTTTLPAPISVAPDQGWDGIDGSWSSFTLRVGTPQQSVRTFVSFAVYQTWVVLPQGCAAAANTTSCAQTRGGIFNESASSTFNQVGTYDLAVDQNLDYGGDAIFGYDTVTLKGVGEGGLTVRNTTVGGFAVYDFYMGIFGINPKPTNFTSFDDPSTSYMTLLKEHSLIASVSAGYTAGASYRFNGTPASLTLGGYDRSKFIANDVEFIFAPDNTRDLVVAIQSISTPSQVDASPTATELLPNPIFAYLDTTIAEIWLPLQACLAFESEFGLVFDNATNLYLVNDTLHQTLTSRNPNMTFILAQGASGGPKVSISLPYAAFDLIATPPYQGLANQSFYFPLRRAANESQFTIGRTFFQEAYLTVDWESQRFNVSQRSWAQNAQDHIVAIAPGSGQESSSGGSTSGTGSTSTSTGGLTGGAIAGIVVGVIAILVLLACLLMWHFHRRNKAAKTPRNEKSGGTQGGAPALRGRDITVLPKAELEGSSPFDRHHYHRTSGQSGSRGLLSSHGSTAASEAPRTPLASSSIGHFGGGGTADSLHSPSSTSNGEGTYSSTHSGSGHGSLPFSPLSPLGASEADSKERPIYEMAGDTPAIREKDGKMLSEKEALAHRERIYNGVDTLQPSSTAAAAAAPSEGAREPRRVSPEDVVRADRAMMTASPPAAGATQPRSFLHRAFSFEGSDDSG